MSTTIGKTIAARRIILGMSRKDLAERAGISYPYIAEIEIGRKEPSISRLRDVATALQWTLSELFSVVEQVDDPDSWRSVSMQLAGRK